MRLRAPPLATTPHPQRLLLLPLRARRQGLLQRAARGSTRGLRPPPARRQQQEQEQEPDLVQDQRSRAR